MLRGLFVTGTDTAAGKSVLSACLLAAMRASGEHAAGIKPVISGLDDTPETGWPADDELLAAITGTDREAVAPLRFGPAVSPHLAAELAGEPIDTADLVSRTREAVAAASVAVVEGVGGLMVPLRGPWLARDLAAELGLPLVIAARPGLGTINHTLLTLEAARAAGLRVSAVVLTPWPAAPRRHRALEPRRRSRELGARRGRDAPRPRRARPRGDGARRRRPAVAPLARRQSDG